VTRRGACVKGQGSEEDDNTLGYRMRRGVNVVEVDLA